MDRRGFIRSIVATAALTTGLARTSFVLADGVGFETGNTLFSIDMITREALRVAHEKLSFIGERKVRWPTHKAGDTLRIRMPGESWSPVVEPFKEGDYSNQTLSVDDFARDYIVPAIEELRSN